MPTGAHSFEPSLLICFINFVVKFVVIIPIELDSIDIEIDISATLTQYD